MSGDDDLFHSKYLFTLLIHYMVSHNCTIIDHLHRSLKEFIKVLIVVTSRLDGCCECLYKCIESYGKSLTYGIQTYAVDQEYRMC